MEQNLSFMLPSDSQRDARRYEQLVLALSEAHQELRDLEQSGITDIEQAIDHLLPRIVAAFGAGYALLTRFDHINENLLIVCCHPFSVWKGQVASPSERILQAIFEGRARIFEGIPGYTPILFIESPFDSQPSAVIFSTFQTPSNNYQVWVCDHQDQSWGPFVGADRLALESIIGLFVGFANIGERRRKELEKIQDISTQITANVDLELLMPELTRLAAQAFEAPASSVMLWNQQHDELVINAAFGLSETYQENLRIQRISLEEILQTYSPSLRTLFTPDLQESPFAQGDLVRGENVRSALSTKLIAEDEWLGVLNIYSLGTVRNFTADEQGLIEILANQAAIAILNARNRKELIKGFLDTSTMLQTGLNRQETFNLVVDKAVEVLKVDEACIFKWDLSNPSMSVHARAGRDGINLQTWKLTQEQAIRIVAVEGEYQANQVYRNSTEPYIADLFYELDKYASALCLPLMVQEKFSGLLVLYNLSPDRKYTKTEVGLVQTFLNQAAAGFQLVELHQSVASQLHQFEQLQEISEKVNSIQADSLAQLTEQLSKYACDLLHADCTVIYPYDDEIKGFEIKHIGSQGLQKAHLFRAKLRNTPGNLTYQVMQSRMLAIVDDVETGWDRHDQFKIRGSQEKKGLITSEEIKSFICCGLYSNLEPIGAIFVNFRRKHWFTEDEQETIKIFANQISTAIQQTRQRQRASQNLAVIQANQVITRRLGKMKAGQQVWKSVLQNAIKIHQAQRGRVVLIDPSTRELKQLVHEGFQSSTKTDLQAREDIYDIAIQKNLRENTLMVPDINENGDFSDFESLEPPVRSILASKIWQGTDRNASGLIILESGTPGNFESYDQKTLFELANYGSIASQVAQSFKATEAQSILQRNLLEAMKVILAQRSLEQMMPVAEKIRQAFHCDIVTFYEYDDIKGELIFSSYVGKFRKPKKVRNNGRVPPGTVVERLLTDGEPIFASNADKHPLFSLGDFIKDEHIISSAGIPLLAGEDRVGVLFINFHQKHEFSDEEQRTVLLFASLAALAIQNSRLHATTLKRSKQLEEIHEASKEIVANLDLGFFETLVKTAVEKVISASGVKPVIGTFHIKRGEELILKSVYPTQNWPASADQTGSTIRLNSDGKIGIIGQAATSKKPINVGNVKDNGNYLKLIESTISELAVPLIDGDNVLGVVNLESNEPARFSKEDESGINTLADLAVVAIQYKQKTEQLVLSTDVALMGAWGAEILHDVKNLTGKIRWVVDGLLDLGSVVGEIREQVEIIDRYAEELDSLPPLPDETPKPGKIQPGTDTPQVDMVLENEIIEFRKKQPENNIVFLPDCPSVTVAIDQKWLVRLLRHLLKNATRVLGNDSNQEIRVTTQLLNSFVVVKVADHGPGVRKEIEELLFKRPIDHQGKKKGLGLLLVKLVSQAYGGDAWLDRNSTGEGAIFAFSMPVFTSTT